MAESEGFEPPRAINPNGFQDRLTTIITTLHKLNVCQYYTQKNLHVKLNSEELGFEPRDAFTPRLSKPLEYHYRIPP